MTLPFRRFTGTVYRGHHPMWAFDPLSGEGARRYGGRFNPPGTAALYTALRPETAWAEAQQAFAFKAQPLTLCAYRADMSDVLDLTDPGTREACAASEDQLACAWEDLSSRKLVPPSWSLAIRLREAGAAALIVPSFASAATSRDKNMIFFSWSPDLPHQLSVIDDDGRLPRDQSSWELH
jgi:RES domain-containing protein